MIYNNLIYLLVVILILTTSSPPERVQLPHLVSLLLFIGKGLAFFTLAHHLFKKRVTSAARYFATEQKLSIAAIVSLALDVYLLNLQYYAGQLPLSTRLPVLTSLSGIALFFGYLSIIWLAARPNYQQIFGRSVSGSSFVAANLKTNIAIVLPWLLLTLFSDLLALTPLPFIKEFLASPWGEPALFLLFLAILVVGLPAIVVRLWGCRPLPPGPTRTLIEEFCRKERLRYADIMIWPLFEGRMLTAGVMGVSRRFRYLLITPALMEAMSDEEIEAVMAHEIGHVKRYHLQLYLFLFLGFGMLAQVSIYPVITLMLNSDLFYRAVTITGKSPDTALTFVSTTLLLVLMVLYFRFIFGFFMRNFERQADLHALHAMGSAAPLIRVFEKIAWLSGKIRDLPSWHHFGIGQRIDYLVKCQRDSLHIGRHHRKVYLALALYLATLGGGAFFMWQMPQDLLGDAPKTKFVEALLLQKIGEEPKNVVWPQLLGDLQFSRRLYDKAFSAYEHALSLAPDHPELLNNLAWLLLTAQDPAVLNPPRALRLAQQAALISQSAHVLDTLATAYWANGQREKAIAVEKEALERAKGNAQFYLGQIERFRTGDYNPEQYGPDRFDETKP